MPKYTYHCHQCGENFEVKHSIGKTWNSCTICNKSGELTRIPSSVFLSKKDYKFDKKNKPGSVVKETIKDIKEELSTERERLSSRTYKQND